MENNQFEADRLLFVNQMEMFLRQEMLPEALEVAEERLVRFPGDVDAGTFINLVLIALGRIEESRNILREWEKDIIEISFAYLRAADAYREKELNQDALLCYQKFCSLNPHACNFQEITEKIAVLQKKEIPAEEVNESTSVDMPGPEFHTVTLADLYLKQGHPKMALDILAEIIKREPDNVQARVKLDTVKATLALKSSTGPTVTSTDNLIKTLSSWLTNIGRLKRHAT